MTVSVALRVNGRLEPSRELWGVFDLPAVPRIGEKIQPVDGWGMAVVIDVQWGLHGGGDVTIVARYPCSAEEVQALIESGWSATVVEAPPRA
jgi:hypothetical protein